MLVLGLLSWRLGPVLAGVILAAGATAFLYRAQTRAVERAAAAAAARMAEAADETFANIRTVRVFAGEGLERERFDRHVAEARQAGLGFSRAKALLESVNRGATHASLLALYALGGELWVGGLWSLQWMDGGGLSTSSCTELSYPPSFVPNPSPSSPRNSESPPHLNPPLPPAPTQATW